MSISWDQELVALEEAAARCSQSSSSDESSTDIVEDIAAGELLPQTPLQSPVSMIKQNVIQCPGPRHPPASQKSGSLRKWRRERMEIWEPKTVLGLENLEVRNK